MSSARAEDDTPDRPTYEQARDELTDVVRRLEAGGVTLEESLTLWQRGEALAEVCQGWLDGARAQLERARPADAATTDTTSESERIRED